MKTKIFFIAMAFVFAVSAASRSGGFRDGVSLVQGKLVFAPAKAFHGQSTKYLLPKSTVPAAHTPCASCAQGPKWHFQNPQAW